MIVISNRIILLIESSEWMKSHSCHHLNIYDCTEPYQVFERIMLGVSASQSITWKTMYKSKQSQPEIFANLCVSIILIDKYLQEIFKMKKEDREILLGANFTQILDFYYRNAN